jgi:hypothetical protein
MPISLEWLIPDQVMGVRWAGIITEQELEALDHDFLQILNTTQTPRIDIISHELDLLEELSLKAYIRTQSPRHPRFGWYIVVQPRHKAFARMITQMACTLLQLRFRIVEDEATAWKVLQRINPQLVKPETTSSNAAS